MDEIHLNTSLTFASSGVLKPHSKPLLGEATFREKHEHFVISDLILAEALRKFAMEEFAIAKALARLSPRMAVEH